MPDAKADKPLFSIVILSWNNKDKTLACIDSVRGLILPRYEIIVVDNGSVDGSKEVLARTKGIKFVDLPKNTGFTGGQNAALPYVEGDYILLLNNDAVIAPNALNVLERGFADETIGAIGGKAFHWNDHNPPYDQHNSFYTYQLISPVTAEVETQTTEAPRREVNNVSGAGVAIRKSAIDKCGYFDDRFFAYYEETDLFARMKKAGYKVIYDPEFQIWHEDQGSTRDKRAFYYHLMFKNQFLYALKNFDDEFLGAFLTTYVRHVRRSVIPAVFGNMICRMRLKAFAWNVLHIFPTLRQRRSLAATYAPGYSERLYAELPQSVSVVIDAVSQPHKVEATLASALDQTIKASEIIIVTTDPDHLRLEDLKAETAIRVVLDRQLLEVSANNYGLITSRFRWLLFVPAGRHLPKSFLHDGLFAGWRDEAAMVYGANRDTLSYSFWKLTRANLVGDVMLVNRDELRQIGGLDDHLPTSARLHDLALRFAIASRGVSAVLVSEKSSPAAGTDASVRQKHARIYTVKYRIIRAIPFRRRIKNTLVKAAKLFRVGKASLRWVTSSQVSAEEKRRVLGLAWTKASHLQFRALKAALQENYHTIQELAPIRPNTPFPAFDINEIVTFINCRDRFDPLMELVAWLEKEGVTKLVFIDNGSTYQPLVDFYAKTKYQVIKLEQNIGHTAPWESMAINLMARDHFYILSDPDIIPLPEAHGAIRRFYGLLEKYDERLKVGFGLLIDDLPDHYNLKHEVEAWEAQFWVNQVEPEVYIADVDTTFGLYYPNTWYFRAFSLRTGRPYVARHEPWYQNSAHPSADAKYYSQHAKRSVNTWSRDELPEHHKRAIRKMTEEGILKERTEEASDTPDGSKKD